MSFFPERPDGYAKFYYFSANSQGVQSGHMQQFPGDPLHQSGSGGLMTDKYRILIPSGYGKTIFESQKVVKEVDNVIPKEKSVIGKDSALGQFGKGESSAEDVGDSEMDKSANLTEEQKTDDSGYATFQQTGLNPEEFIHAMQDTLKRKFSSTTVSKPKTKKPKKSHFLTK